MALMNRFSALKSFLLPFLLPVRNLFFRCKYFYKLPFGNISLPIDSDSRVLIIGSSSDIATAFLSLLKEVNCEIVCTSRRTSDYKDSKIFISSYKKNQFAHLDLDSSSSILEFIKSSEVDKPFSHIICFAGLLDANKFPLSSLTHISKDMYDFPSLKKYINVNALSIFEVITLLISKHFDYYQSNHLLVGVLTSSYGFRSFPDGLNIIGYRSGKTLLHYLFNNLYYEARRAGITSTFLMLGPGYVRTKMTYGSGQLTPDQSAKLILRHIQTYGSIMKMIYISSTGKLRSTL